MQTRSVITGLSLLFALAAAGPVLAQGGPAPFAPSKSLTCAQALKEAPKDDAELSPLAKSLAESDAKLKKSPKNPALKKAYVDAGFKYGDTLMHLPQGKLKPAVQYRAALALFRLVLAVDPKHQGSLAEKKTIEDIYKGMPGGIPK